MTVLIMATSQLGRRPRPAARPGAFLAVLSLAIAGHAAAQTAPPMAQIQTPSTRRVAPPPRVEMATVTGGRSFQVANASMLPGALSAIADELRFQYLIGYVPAGQSGRPGWRSIQVRVNRPDARVRARDGYVHP